MIRGGFNCGENNTVVFSGDWHIGNKYADKKGLQKMINTIKKEGSHLVIMGDIWDSITAKDKRHDGGMCDPLFVGSDPIYNAFEWVQDLLKPIKSQIMYIHTGNHEHTITKCCEIDLAKMLAKNLNVRYADYASHMRYTFKKSTNSQSYVIYTTHGFVSGRKRGGKVNSLEDTAAFMDFDLMAAGLYFKKMCFKGISADSVRLEGSLLVLTMSDCEILKISSAFLLSQQSKSFEMVDSASEPKRNGCTGCNQA